jgi:hypothetical protein
MMNWPEGTASTDALLVMALVISGPLHFALECWDDSIHWKAGLERKEHLVHGLLASLAFCIALSANSLGFSPGCIPVFLLLIILAVVLEEVVGIHDRCALKTERVLHSTIFLNGTFLAMALFHVTVNPELASVSLVVLVCRLLLVGAALRLVGVIACALKPCHPRKHAPSRV